MADRNVNPFSKSFVYLLMLVFTVLAIYPIFWLVIQSFKTTQEYLTASKLSFPGQWVFANYPHVWITGGFQTLFVNSVIYTVVTVTMVVVLANMAGFAFAKLHFKITPLLHGLFIIGILLTVQSILIPIFLMVNAAGLFNTRLGVLIPYIGLGLPMGIYLCTEFIKGIPTELIESARIDGSGYLRTFARIIFPMCTPVAITLSIITFTATWNEFILMNVLTAGGWFKSIPAGVGRYAGTLGADFGRLFTSLVIALIPILIFYTIFRNQITKGVTAGAVKG